MQAEGLPPCLFSLHAAQLQGALSAQCVSSRSGLASCLDPGKPLPKAAQIPRSPPLAHAVLS